MKNIYESRFYSILTKFSNLVFANLLFIVGSVPILTTGVSLRALYFTCNQLSQGDSRVAHCFWSKYRESFLNVFFFSATYIIAISILVIDILIVLQFWRPVFADILVGLLLSAGIVILSTGSYLFPILAFTDMKNWPAVSQSFILSMRYLPRTVIICILNILPFALIIFWTYILSVILPIWICIGFAFTAHINSCLLHPALNDIESKEIK